MFKKIKRAMFKKVETQYCHAAGTWVLFQFETEKFFLYDLNDCTITEVTHVK